MCVYIYIFLYVWMLECLSYIDAYIQRIPNTYIQSFEINVSYMHTCIHEYDEAIIRFF